MARGLGGHVRISETTSQQTQTGRSFKKGEECPHVGMEKPSIRIEEENEFTSRLHKPQIVAHGESNISVIGDYPKTGKHRASFLYRAVGRCIVHQNDVIATSCPLLPVTFKACRNVVRCVPVQNDNGQQRRLILNASQFATSPKASSRSSRSEFDTLPSPSMSESRGVSHSLSTFNPK